MRTDEMVSTVIVQCLSSVLLALSVHLYDKDHGLYCSISSKGGNSKTRVL